MDRLKDRVIIVTGGAHGIGRAYCRGLAAEGAKVVVADLDIGAAEAVVRSLGELGSDALAVRADVSQAEDVDAMAQVAADRFGSVDGLINNAAVFQVPAMSRVPFEQIPIDEWDRLIAVNLRGVFLGCRAVVPYMKAQGRGKIVNISSGTVFHGSANSAHYVTSKAGVIGFTRSLARELGDHNINVNAIAPGTNPEPGRNDRGPSADEPEPGASQSNQAGSGAGRPGGHGGFPVLAGQRFYNRADHCRGRRRANALTPSPGLGSA